MRSAERIVLALGSSCETRKPPATAQGSDTAAPPSEDLVRISLMSDIPNEPVVRRVKYIMQRDRKFHDAEPRSEMPACDRDGIDGLGAQLICELDEIGFVQTAQIRWR